MYVACAPDFYICVCIAPVIEEVDPCNPSPCGSYSQCRNVNAQGVCSCLQTYIGSPPGCRPECVASSECPQNRACINLKCVDPCPGPCGLNTRCETVNHSPICSCRQGFTGDPFTRCYAVPRKHCLIHFIFAQQSVTSLSLQCDSCYLDCASEIQGYKFPADVQSRNVLFCFSISFLIFVISDFNSIHK